MVKLSLEEQFLLYFTQNFERKLLVEHSKQSYVQFHRIRQLFLFKVLFYEE